MPTSHDLPSPSDRDQFLSEIDAQLREREIKSWQTLRVTEKTPFRNWGHEALAVLGQEGVPFFDERSHLSPQFTGFVGHGVLGNEDFDFAYINNGVPSFTQKDASRLSDGILRYETSWRDGSFRLNEIYSGFDFPRSDEAILTSRAKVAQYIDESDKLRFVVSQHSDDRITIRVDEFNEDRKKWGWGSTGVIEVRLDPNSPDYQRILTAMQADPEFFLSPAKIIPLLTGVQIEPSSRVHYGFKDGKRGDDYSATTRKIENNLSFEEAVKIAFPMIPQQNSPLRPS